MINRLTGQESALVSDVAGTTTDPVYKAMELHGLGPVVFIDTPGFDDVGELGEKRVERTIKVLEKSDLVLFVYTNAMTPLEKEWLERIQRMKVDYLLVHNVFEGRKIAGDTGFERAPIAIDALKGDGVDTLRTTIVEHIGRRQKPKIFGDTITKSDLVLLVMPQDIQAPEGRLILPQVQSIRELLDAHAIVMCVTVDELAEGLSRLKEPPKLIVTDSQVFGAVYALKPESSKLTSFSVLFAALKGDMDYFVSSTAIVDHLDGDSKILIAEACTHAPLEEDIGRVKIPALLRKRYGNMAIDFVRGDDMPENLMDYDLVIHCGACMFNRTHVLRRVEMAREQGVPMSNYGVILAKLTGILDVIEV